MSVFRKQQASVYSIIITCQNNQLNSLVVLLYILTITIGLWAQFVFGAFQYFKINIFKLSLVICPKLGEFKSGP